MKFIVVFKSVVTVYLIIYIGRYSFNNILIYRNVFINRHFKTWCRVISPFFLPLHEIFCVYFVYTTALMNLIQVQLIENYTKALILWLAAVLL